MAKAKLKLDGAAITKRLKISKAQQTMLLAVGAAAVMLGVAVVLAVYFIKYISFNSRVISAKDEAIVGYSKAIKDSGACTKPRDGKTYTDDELRKCSPNDLDTDKVPGSLKYKVLVDEASNVGLESVARNSLSVCKDPSTGNQYTYKDLLDKYQNAESSSDRGYYLSAIKICSALRVVPDALPMQKNEEALLASLNQIFIVSDWMPESLSPSSSSTPSNETGLLTIPVNLSIEASNDKTLTVINNIERSIREFSITSATIEWSGDTQLNVNAKANAYYVSGADELETTKTIKATDKKKGKK